MRQNPDIIIIGAGIIGSSIALELSKKGFRTLSIEKLHTAGYGSTAGSCGVIRAHLFHRGGRPFCLRGILLLAGLGEPHRHGRMSSDWPSTLTVGRSSSKPKGTTTKRSCDTTARWAWNTKNGRMSSCRAESRFLIRNPITPPTRPDDKKFWEKPNRDIEGAIFTPESGYCTDTSLATHNVMRGAEAKGAKFLFNQEVSEIRRSNGRVQGVTLKSGDRIDAPVVVNCAGPHSFIINRLAGVEEMMNIKTMALRHEVHHVVAPEGFDFGKDGIHTSDGDNRIYLRPDTGNSILVGSEDPECDEQEWVEDPDNFNRNVTEAQWKAQVYRAARRIPDLKIPNRPKGIADLYDVSDDWIPIYDRSDLEGFYMAVGTSGNQFKTAPVVGWAMANLIERCENGQDHDRDPVTAKAVHKGL